MLKYIGKRMLLVFPIIIMASFIIFTIISLTPGDPAQVIAGEQATAAQIEAIRAELGLNDHFVIQYFRWLGNLLRLDLGKSWESGQVPVWTITKDRIPVTLKLGLASIIISNLIAIPTGVATAVKRGTWVDSVGMGIALLGVSMPNFWLGYILLNSLASGDGLFPVLYDSSKMLWWALPAIALGTGSAATVTRMSRSTLIDTFGQDFIKTARAKGLPERTVIWKHALQNSLLPVITVIGLQAGFIIAGAALTETVFNIPGMGTGMVQAINNKNAPAVLGIAVIIMFFITLSNTIVDILYSFVDPRIKSSVSKGKVKTRKTVSASVIAAKAKDSGIKAKGANT